MTIAISIEQEIETRNLGPRTTRNAKLNLKKKKGTKKKTQNQGKESRKKNNTTLCPLPAVCVCATVDVEVWKRRGKARRQNEGKTKSITIGSTMTNSGSSSCWCDDRWRRGMRTEKMNFLSNTTSSYSFFLVWSRCCYEVILILRWCCNWLRRNCQR